MAWSCARGARYWERSPEENVYCFGAVSWEPTVIMAEWLLSGPLWLSSCFVLRRYPWFSFVSVLISLLALKANALVSPKYDDLPTLRLH